MKTKELIHEIIIVEKMRTETWSQGSKHNANNDIDLEYIGIYVCSAKKHVAC